jgi:hypothetical protein
MTIPSQPIVAAVDHLSVNRVAVDEGIVAVARDVGPIIAKHAETTERNRRLAPPVIGASSGGTLPPVHTAGNRRFGD